MNETICMKPISWTYSEKYLCCSGYSKEYTSIFLKIPRNDTSEVEVPSPLTRFFVSRNLSPYQWITISDYSPVMDEVADINITTEVFCVKNEKDNTTIISKLFYVNFLNSAYVITTTKDYSRSYVITTDQEEFIPESSVRIIVKDKEEIKERVVSLCNLFSPDRVISYDNNVDLPDVINMTKTHELGFTDSYSTPIQEKLELTCNA